MHFLGNRIIVFIMFGAWMGIAAAQPSGDPLALPVMPVSEGLDAKPLPAVAEIINKTRDNLPKTNVRIEGEIFRGERRGKLNRVHYVDAQLNLGGDPPSVCYILRDNFGSPFQRLTIARAPSQEPVVIYEKGPQMERGSLPKKNSFIENTDVRWQDLTLDFLWWTNGAAVGRETLMGRNCAILEFIPPQAPLRTKLWIEEKLLVLIKIEEYDAQSNPQRTMTVRSLKKIGDTWMIKDMDIRNHASKRRTLIRFNNVVAVSD